MGVRESEDLKDKNTCTMQQKSFLVLQKGFFYTQIIKTDTIGFKILKLKLNFALKKKQYYV
jgi:hypothetical protein